MLGRCVLASVVVDTPTIDLTRHPDRASMGAAAGAAAARTLREAVAARGSARMIAAAAPSQDEVYAALAAAPDVPWDRITVLHMDEYLGLEPDAPQRFASWLGRSFVGVVRPAAFHPIPGDLAPELAVAAYRDLVTSAPIDLVCLGIGVNGHIAFNDPPLADLDDPEPVRVVELDEVSRIQQVDDGCFAALDEVPTRAITLTIPTLMAGAHLVCSVPDRRKAAAVRALVREPIDGRWPCTVLRRHPRCEVHVDADAARLLAGP